MSYGKWLSRLVVLPAFTLLAMCPRPIRAQDGSGLLVTSPADVHMAVVEILSAGRAMPYAAWETTVDIGAGSGFVVDPAGVVVTNAHVVNGGNLFLVYLSGEDEPRNAVLLGVSECDDLAVLDIRGDGFPYLAWQESPVLRSQLVIAAGYPDGRYTETRGRVLDTELGADTDWASLEDVVRHTAELHPGNSGGPLVNRFGEVVAVNYGVNEETAASYSIPNTIAAPLAQQLAEGADVDSLGINGLAFAEDEAWYGIWVVAVKSGSPADQAGLQPGDVIYRLEGINVGADGTFGAYCDILRSHRPGQAIAFDVLRNGDFYAGQFNGRALAAQGQAGGQAADVDGGLTGMAAAAHTAAENEEE
jgi:serine protease Do